MFLSPVHPFAPSHTPRRHFQDAAALEWKFSAIPPCAPPPPPREHLLTKHGVGAEQSPEMDSVTGKTSGMALIGLFAIALPSGEAKRHRRPLGRLPRAVTGHVVVGCPSTGRGERKKADSQKLETNTLPMSKALELSLREYGCRIWHHYSELAATIDSLIPDMEQGNRLSNPTKDYFSQIKQPTTQAGY